MDYARAGKLNDARREIIRENRARRMRSGEKKPPLPVPPIAVADLVPICYEPDGTYYGRLGDVDECPPGFTVVLEPATW